MSILQKIKKSYSNLIKSIKNCYSSDRKDKEKVNSIFLITILLKEIRKK